jgi:sulfur carrier protein
MKIKLNGTDKILNDNMALINLIKTELNSAEPKGVAVAVNDTVIPKQKWNETVLKDNDSIEIVRAVQGG